MTVATLLTGSPIHIQAYACCFFCVFPDRSEKSRGEPAQVQMAWEENWVLELRVLGFRVLELATPPRSPMVVQIWTLNRVKSCLLKLKAFTPTV